MTHFVSTHTNHISELRNEVKGFEIIKDELKAGLKSPYSLEQVSQTLALREMQLEASLDFFRR